MGFLLGGKLWLILPRLSGKAASLSRVLSSFLFTTRHSMFGLLAFFPC